MTDENKTIAESSNLADERRAQLTGLVPEAFSEGRLDVAALKRALGEEAVIEGGERAHMGGQWPPPRPSRGPFVSNRV